MTSSPTVHLAAPQAQGQPKRALVLPGGGLRLSYQAGILVALEEAGLSFQFMDGTSGGSLNLSMLLSGLSPAEACQRWRSLNLADTVSFLPLKEYLHVDTLEGIGDGDGFRNKVLPHFGIDFDRIHQVDAVRANYNVLDYGNKAVKTIPHRLIDEDMVIGGMSLPGVFPPVRKEGSIYLDTGFVQDANLLEAVKHGAEEIWVLWGLGNTGTYRGGVLNLYVQMLEVSANTALNNQLDTIRDLNARIEQGVGPYGQTRPIQVRVIRPDYPLPLDPDLYLCKINHTTLIEMGYADGKAYLRRLDELPAEIPANPTHMHDPLQGIRFQAPLEGKLDLLADQSNAAHDIQINLTVHVNDVNRFIAGPEHEARVTGHLSGSIFGALKMIEEGRFTLECLTDKTRRIVYSLSYSQDGQHYNLLAEQVLHDDQGLDLWNDLSNLSLNLFKVNAEASELVANGTLRLPLGSVKDWIQSFHVTETTGLMEKLSVTTRFARSILGGVYDAHI